MNGYPVPSELDVYRVEVWCDEADSWDRPYPVVAGWSAAVAQLREAFDVALEGVDEDPDAMARDCTALLAEIERGSFDGWTPRGSSGRFVVLRSAEIETFTWTSADASAA